MDKIKDIWRIAKYEPIGLIAAQSMGEPGTQMTMRSFHYAGMAEQVPTGLPRLIELVDARKIPKKPLMDVYLDKKHSKTEKVAQEVAQRIESVYLKQIADIKENLIERTLIILVKEDEMKFLGVTIDDVRKVVREKYKDKTSKISSKENKIRLIFEDDAKLSSIRKVFLKLLSLHIKGVKDVKKALVIQEDDQYKIFTTGSNILAVREIEGVDKERVYSNDIKEIEKALGIEAARNKIVEQIQFVMKSQGLNVDYRHIMLLADAMCYGGEIKSIGRHGLAGAKPSVFARAAFEETVRHLTEAAVVGSIDSLEGVTENILIGQTVPLGTGRIKLKVAQNR